ncbi:MAG: amidohydrolase family protein [Verrucomicrobiota bacterium]|jgi:imidazolonepropionase-like amidohydrolase
MKPASGHWRWAIGRALRVVLLLGLGFPGTKVLSAEAILLRGATVHTVSGATFSPGDVLIEGEKIAAVGQSLSAPNAKVIELVGQQLYPGLIALDTTLGLIELDAVRATDDTSEVGDYSPDVLSWISVNPDSELLPVARGGGIAYFEPVPHGGVVSGQSALVRLDGWTTEQMTVKKNLSLHVAWPPQQLDPTPKEKFSDPSKWKSLEDQDKERRIKTRELAEFFDEARAYAKAKDAATNGVALPEKVPAWEAMLPYARGELPVTIHADDVRQIKSAVAWAVTNHFKIILAGGRDAWRAADLLAANHVPVIYEDAQATPARDTDSYAAQFRAPEILRAAGVTVAFSVGGATLVKNMPYAAAQAVAFGLPADEAVRGLTLYPAQIAGVADRLGSIEAGKEATLIATDGDLLDLRSNVKRMWIAGRMVDLESRHTRLYEKYKNRPQP